jgi:hypothetical protein
MTVGASKELTNQNGCTQFKTSQGSVNPDSGRITGPIFGPADWQRALDVLDECLQNFEWCSGENKITVDSIFRAMHSRGLTLSHIEAYLGRLVDAGVFKPGSLTIPAGYYREPGTPMPILRTFSETTVFFVTTSEKWFTYLAEQRLAQADEKRILQTLEQETRSKQDLRGSRDEVAIVSEEKGVATDGADAFAVFSKKQRQLLLCLQSRLPTPIAQVLRAIYGRTNTNNKALEQLVSRTNRSLSAWDTGLEIKRKANTYQLLPI